ncbi:MAG: LacI family DNA-binding transcriptional regulator [Pirellulales bacterium]|nr:LacI family DNA-binding transcriptional regulator [Pirellulales bacterium]
MAATIRDVATAAEVSVGTVSRVINGHPAVSGEIVGRVLDAIETLKYHPRQRKASNQALNPLERMNVMLILLGMDRSLVSLPVVASAIHGVEAALAEARANLLFSDLPDVRRLPEAIAQNRVDAVILKGALQGDLAGATDPVLAGKLRSLPAVWVLGRPEGFFGDVVQVDDMIVGRMAAEYLVSKGHRRLAFISVKPSQVTLMRRQASFMFFAQQAGASVQAYLGDQQQWQFPSRAVDEVEDVQALLDRLLNEPKRPTAVFAPDDSVGAMLYGALARRGLQAGRDLSLISCNNDKPLLTGLYPSVTTIDVHAEEIGRRAVDQLAWRWSRPGRPYQDVGIEPNLVEGESVMQI